MSKVAIVFPGQGSQYFQMGFDFFNEPNCTKYQEIQSLLFAKNPNLKACLYEEETVALNETQNAQLGILGMELGIFAQISEKIKPDAVAGFSLGEYSALCASGIFSVEEIIEIVAIRSKLMHESQVAGEMHAVLKVTYEELVAHLKAIDSKLEVANYNTEQQVILSGTSDDFMRDLPKLKELGVRKIMKLKVAGPFHSSLYRETSELFKVELSKFKADAPKTDLYLNTTAQKYTTENIEEQMVKHLITGVNWYPQIKQMIADGITTFIEIGPGNTLSGMIKKIDSNVEVINIEKLEDIQKVEELCQK
ncbi:MAG: ACP S-malonyltransferase [Mycoplasmatales bacterium]